MLTYVIVRTKILMKGEFMTDYSEPIINTREFLRRAEHCLLANNPTGAYHHAMNAFKETQLIMDYCLKEMEENETNEQTQSTSDIRQCSE